MTNKVKAVIFCVSLLVTAGVVTYALMFFPR